MSWKSEENMKNILNYIYDLRNYFDYENIEDYQLLLFLIFNNYKYNQDNTIIGNETNYVIRIIVNKFNEKLKLSDKYYLQYYNELNNNFNINNILDYQKFLFLYIADTAQAYQKDGLMANLCEIIYNIDKTQF